VVRRKQLALWVILAVGTACSGGETPIDAAVCNPDLSFLSTEFGTIGPYAEPRPSVPFVRPDGNSLTVEVLLEPWEVSNYNQYWLHPDASEVRVRLRWMLGLARPDTGRVLVRTFINGHSPAEPEAAVADVTDGLAEHTLHLPSELFPRGRSTLHVYSRVIQGERLSSDFTAMFPVEVYRESMELLEPVAESTGFVVQDADANRRSYVIDRVAGFPFDAVTYPPTDGVYSLDIHVQNAVGDIADCNESDTIAIVGLLDGEPISIGGSPALVTTVSSGDQHVFSVDVHGLPEDGEIHTLQILELGSIGRVLSDAWGGFTPWGSVTRPVANAEWN